MPTLPNLPGLDQIAFYGLAGLIAMASVMVVASRNAVTSAIFLVVDLFLLAGVYASLDAHFIAAIQVLVYAGAIVVLFMFVIMLINLKSDARDSLRIPVPELGVLLFTLIGFLVVAVMLAGDEPGIGGGDMSSAAIEEAGGNTYVVGMVLFTRYLWPFELASVLILLAIIASIVIAKKDKPSLAGDKRGKVAHGTR